MLNKAEIDMLIGVLKSILVVIETIDPAAKQNKVVIEIEKVLSTLQAIGL